MKALSLLFSVSCLSFCAAAQISGPTTVCTSDSIVLHADFSAVLQWQLNSPGAGDTSIVKFDYKTPGNANDIVVHGIMPGTAKITCINTIGQYDTIIISVSACATGIPSLSSNEKTIVYPNPANSNLTVTAASKINNLAIIDLLGRTVCTGKYNAAQVQIDIAPLRPGIYFLEINGSETIKFVKE